MKTLLLLFILGSVGCASFDEVAQGFAAGGSAAQEQRVERQEASKRPDSTCMSDCTSRYSRSFCQSKCSY